VGLMKKSISTRSPLDEGADAGLDRASAVTIKTIGPRRYSAYGGQIDKVTLQIYPKDTDQKKG